MLLDIPRERLDETPWITSILEDAGIALRVWEYLKGSANADARALVKKRAELPSNVARECPIEALCIACGIETRKVLGVIMEEVFLQSDMASQLLAAASHREVVQATVDMALAPGGTQERRMLLQHSKFVPIPKTSIISVHGNGTVVGGNQTNVAVLPPVEDSVKRLNERFADRFNDAVGPVIEAAVVESLASGDDGDEDGDE